MKKGPEGPFRIRLAAWGQISTTWVPTLVRP